MQNGDFDVKKEAAWAITNATSGGSTQQIEYLVECECVKPLVDLLTVSGDAAIIGVGLDAIENIMKMGKQKQEEMGLEENPMLARFEAADGLRKLEKLQEDANEEVYHKAVNLLQTYFILEDDADITEGVRRNPLEFGKVVPGPEGGFPFATNM